MIFPALLNSVGNGARNGSMFLASLPPAGQFGKAPNKTCLECKLIHNPA